MKSLLIVNADDCNLTAGVTSAILDCHDHGIVTSTTFLINLPVRMQTVREIRRRKRLGVGIHLNVTLKQPVSRPARVRSLLAADGTFKKWAVQLEAPPKASELSAEYQSQIDLFRKIFSRNPTHLDTHHHVHGHRLFFDVFCETARHNRLPVRRCRFFLLGKKTVRTPDFFFGNLSKDHYWTELPLRALLSALPCGVSEIMCHPGKADKELKAISSFTTGRETEWRLLRSHKLRRKIENSGVVLSHYGLCYT